MTIAVFFFSMCATVGLIFHSIIIVCQVHEHVKDNDMTEYKMGKLINSMSNKYLVSIFAMIGSWTWLFYLLHQNN